jgi:hypothetical protein
LFRPITLVYWTFSYASAENLEKYHQHRWNREKEPGRSRNYSKPRKDCFEETMHPKLQI